MASYSGYKHGVYSVIMDTAVVPMAQVSQPPVVVGVSPQHLANNPAGANNPILCYSLAEFVERFGWSEDFSKYPLCEAAYVFFQLYNVAPVVFINVLSADKHTYAAAATYTVTAAKTEIVIDKPVLLDRLWVTSGNKSKWTLTAGETLTAAITLPTSFVKSLVTEVRAGTGAEEITLAAADYTLTNTTITLTAAGAAKVGALVGAKKITLSTRRALTLDVDYSKGHDSMGRAVVTINKVNKIVDDKVMVAYQYYDTSRDNTSEKSVKSSDIIGGYDAQQNKNTGLECIEDIYPRYGLIPGTLLAPYWSQTAEIALIMPAKCEDVNGCFKTLCITDISTYSAKRYSEVVETKSAKNFYSDTVYINQAQASYLNGECVVTALRFGGGFQLFGNRTSIYDYSTDPAKSFIPVRRMMQFVANTLVVSYLSRLDMPINKRNIEACLDSAQLWLNGLVARGALVGGEIQFLEDENSVVDLSDGKVTFHINLAAPSPARIITFRLEYDSKFYSSLFS